MLEPRMVASKTQDPGRMQAVFWSENRGAFANQIPAGGVSQEEVKVFPKPPIVQAGFPWVLK